MLGLTAWALVCLIAAGIAWGGVRKANGFWLAALAAACLATLALNGMWALEHLNLAMQAYSMGVPAPAGVDVNLFAITALLITVKFSPGWLLGR